MNQHIGWPAFIVLGLLVFFGIIVTSAFVLLSLEEAGTTLAATDATSVADVVDMMAFLEQADAARGADLILTYNCNACHISAAGVGIAPAFAGLAERASTRRPTLSAAEYIYESIVAPKAFVVEGFADTMPINFAERLSDTELGDIIAYLLSPDAT